MNMTAVTFLVQNPGFLIREFFIESLGVVAIAYGAAWILLRPRDKQAPRPSAKRHFVGVLVAGLICTVVRVFAVFLPS